MLIRFARASGVASRFQRRMLAARRGERLRHATQCLTSRIPVIQTDCLPQERIHSGNLLKVICGGPNAWKSIRQQFELPRAIPSSLCVGLGRCDCCVDCNSGVEIDLVAGSSADLELCHGQDRHAPSCLSAPFLSFGIRRMSAASGEMAFQSFRTPTALSLPSAFSFFTEPAPRL